jgi:hypothetical protein
LQSAKIGGMAKFTATLKAAVGKGAREVFWIPMSLSLTLIAVIGTITVAVLDLLHLLR